MASNATISRYRPALCVLAALAAGYTIYYVHSARQASITPREPHQRIRRRQANNRRRARPAQFEELISSQTEELAAFLDYPQTNWDAKRLFDEWRACPDRFGEGYLLPQKHWPDQENPLTILLQKGVPSLSSLIDDFGASIQDAQAVLRDYDETMLRTFICQRVPPRCTLVDPGGPDMFTLAFSAESECLNYPIVIRSVVQLFNAGAYDYSAMRKDTYKRFHVHPPEVRGTNGLDLDHISLAPVEQHIGYANDPGRFERLDEPLDVADNVSESAQSWYEDDSSENKKEGPQTLLNMLYHIAEDQARREGFVHRGISCKGCHSSPITGLRYKCINCVNFDLCETCEAMQQHPKTHLFLKIRIPTPAYTSSKKPEPLWYPGKTMGLPNNLKPQRNKQLSEDSGFNENEIEALWDQFKNLAATPWPTDPMGFCWAIDRVTFHRCFALSTGSAPRGHPTSLVYDRLFRLYDYNYDGLIGFEEFIKGIAASRGRSPGKRMKRTFDGFDFDEDGFISRKDVLAIFKACYALSKDLARDLFAEYEVDLLDGGSLRDNITGNQPISSAFTGMYESSDRHRRIGQGKTRDDNGELIVTDSHGILSTQNDDEGDLDQIIGDLKEISIYGNYFDGISDTKSSSNMQTFLSNIPPNRHVEASLASLPSANLVDSQTGNNLLPQGTADEADNNENDRRWIFFEDSGDANSRLSQERKAARQEAVTDRNSRAQFYDDDTRQQIASTSDLSEPRSDVLSQTLDQDASNGEHNDGTKKPSLSIPKDEAYVTEARIPPPMSEDIGQEMLFQITRECINELIDPLFRYREDLTLCFEHFKDFFESCKDHLEIDKCTIVGVNLAPGLIRTAREGLAWSHLQRYLKARAEDPHMFGRKESYPLIKFLQAVDEEDSPHYKNYMTDKESILSHLMNGKGVPYTLDYSQELLRNKTEASKHQPVQLSETETQPTPSLSSETFQSEESEIEYPPAAIELHETVRLFNDNDTTLEENISKQNLGDLLEDSGYGILPDGHTKNTTLGFPIDPTLPQNRPNALPSITISPINTNNSHQPSHAEETTAKDHKIMLPEPFNPHMDQYIPSVKESWSAEFRQFLRFLLVLERVHHDDVRRGGPGRINFREYSDIVNGAAYADLEFLGHWIDMQAM